MTKGSYIYRLEDGRTLTAGGPGGYVVAYRADPRWRDYLARHQAVDFSVDFHDERGLPHWFAQPNPDFNSRLVPADEDKGGTDDNQPFIFILQRKPLSTEDRKDNIRKRIRQELVEEAVEALIMNDTTKIANLRDRVSNIRQEETTRS